MNNVAIGHDNISNIFAEREIIGYIELNNRIYFLTSGRTAVYFKNQTAAREAVHFYKIPLCDAVEKNVDNIFKNCVEMTSHL